MIELIRKYKSQILYLVFGVLTTIINIGVYHICYNIAGINNIASTVAAWFITIIAAYATNKVWVFGSKSFRLKVLVYELFSFFACRIFAEIIEVLIMYLAVDTMQWNALLWKAVSNVIVVVVNYILSKLVIFKKK